MDGIHKYQATIENTVIELTVRDDSPSLTDGENHTLHLIHQHVSAEIFACAEGEYILCTNDCEITLHSGDVAIVPPGFLHTLRSENPGVNGYIFRFICFPKAGIGFSDLYSLFTPFLSSNHVLTYRNQSAMVEKAKEILEHRKKAQPFYPVFKLVELLMIASESGTDTQDIHTGTGEGYVDIQFMMRLEDIIDAYYNKPCTMEEIAAMLNISTRQINRILKKWYNKTLRELFIEQRIQVAEHYLVATDLCLEKIAEQVGFSSYPCFYREFFKKHNTSPTAYRKKYTQSK